MEGDRIVTLPLKTCELLGVLVEHSGTVLTKDELIDSVWKDIFVEESNLSHHIAVLRKTLGKRENGETFIETIRSRGYRFTGDVREFSHVTADRPAAHAVNVERSDNIYSVSEWSRDAVAVTPTPELRPAASKRIVPMAVVVIVALAAIVFGIYRFTSGRTWGAEAGHIPFRDSEITRLTTTGTSKRAAISPDGRYFAHIITGPDGDSLWVRQVAVANDTRLTSPSQSEYVWVTFAPDGNFIYYLALDRDKGEPELFRVAVLGGPIVKVVNDIAPPTFSPDGTKMAYMKTDKEESKLFVANADGTNAVIILTRHDPDYMNMFWYAPAWSLDGKTLAVSVDQGDENGRYETVLAVDAETGAERKLTDTRWQQVGQPRWLEDGIVVTASESSTASQQLWHISLPDGTASRITRDLNNYQDISLTTDTKQLVVIQDHNVSNIWTLDGDAANAKQIISEAGRFNEIIWLPDGRIAYTSNAGGSSDIWTMNADGSNNRQITVGANARLGIAVTADQRQLVFAAERDGKYNLWRVDIDGGNLTRITNGDGEYYPQCTPDGRWIVYQSGANRPTLWKMPAAGGPGEAITTSTASRPSLSPDGKFVAYHYLDWTFERGRWSIGVIDLEDGKQVKRFDFPSTVVERLVKWTRDGKAIAFLNSPNGVPNIWLQPVDGGTPKALTDFSSDNIIAFNWKSDGSELAVIRGVETSDVVLINRSSSK